MMAAHGKPTLLGVWERWGSPGCAAHSLPLALKHSLNRHSAPPRRLPARLQLATAVAAPSKSSAPTRLSAAVPDSNSAQQLPEATVNLVAVVPANTKSPLSRNGDDASWEEVLQHTATRLRFINPGFQLHVFTDKIVKVGGLLL